jgi:hypothetical protein
VEPTTPLSPPGVLCAATDAPLIGERAQRAGASRWKVALSAPVRGERYPFERQPREPDRKAGTPTPLAATGAPKSTASQPHCPMELDERLASAPVRLPRRNDAPLIVERAAMRGRVAMECGDAHGVRQLKPPWRPNVLDRNAIANDPIKDAHTRR